jgi:hypothetical protein
MHIVQFIDIIDIIDIIAASIDTAPVVGTRRHDGHTSYLFSSMVFTVSEPVCTVEAAFGIPLGDSPESHRAQSRARLR